MRVLVAAVVACLMVCPVTASAQQSRTEVLERQRAEKATQLKPYEPKKLEKFVKNAEEGKLRRLIAPHNGFFVEYGYRGITGYRLREQGLPQPSGRNTYTSRYELGRTFTLTASYTY